MSRHLRTLIAAIDPLPTIEPSGARSTWSPGEGLLPPPRFGPGARGRRLYRPTRSLPSRRVIRAVTPSAGDTPS
jgi:hypothetical protein